jgi:hypothetical protein
MILDGSVPIAAMGNWEEKTMSAGDARQEPTLDRPDRVDAIIAFLTPAIEEILTRLEGDEFTTPEFIALLVTDPAANRAYQEALRRWGEGEHYAKMVIHGQVIPGILRRSGRLEWLGFAYGEEDPFGVPARWRLLGAGEIEADADQDLPRGTQST